MQEQFSLLKQENYQLKNEISQLKNAFDLNRDILKIISDEAKSQNPRVQMLFQIINRLTSINNQIMINTAELIQEKNQQKLQKQNLKGENARLREQIEQMLQNQQTLNKSIKINQLSLYFKNKIHQMEEQMKALQQERIIKEHEIQFLNKKLQYYEGQSNKISIIPTIDKKNPQKKLIQYPPSTLVPPLQNLRKHSTNKETKLQMKVQILNKQMRKIKIYCQQLEYRLMTFIKVMDLEEDIQKKEKETLKKQHRKCLEEAYSNEVIEVKLLKFALNNLIKQQKDQGRDMMFTITNRNLRNTTNRNLRNTNKQSAQNIQNMIKTRQCYLYKSVQKYNKVQMKPKFHETESDEKQKA